jgi:hypothetical protein
MRFKAILTATAGLTVLGSSLLISASALAQQSGKHAQTADERHAIQVVNQFAKDLRTNPQEAGTLLADNLLWGDPRMKLQTRGSACASKMLTMFTNKTSNDPNQFRINSVEIVSDSATGGAGDVYVLMRRIDHGMQNGKKHDELVGVFFRVDPKTWKIEQWLEGPLNVEPLPAGAGDGGPPPFCKGL